MYPHASLHTTDVSCQAFREERNLQHGLVNALSFTQ
jgi:hypothetical protein